QPAELFVIDDADDFPGNLRTELRLARNDFLNKNALANGLHVLEESVREPVVDNHRVRSALSVVLVQEPAFEKSNTQRAEVRRTQAFIGQALAIGSIDNWFIRQLERHPVTRARHRRRAAQSHITHTGYSLYGFGKLCVVGIQCRGIGILLIRGWKTERQNAR